MRSAPYGNYMGEVLQPANYPHEMQSRRPLLFRLFENRRRIGEAEGSRIAIQRIVVNLVSVKICLFSLWVIMMDACLIKRDKPDLV